MSAAFTVLTEFRFEIASAVAGSRTLQNELGKVSNAASQALDSIHSMGMGIVAKMGLGYGGIAGFLYNAIQASEKFAQSQRNLTNILSVNAGILGIEGTTFRQQMQMSEKILDKIADKSIKWAIDPNMVLDQAKLVSAMLIPKGLDNAGMDRSIDIARGLMKSGPTLGVDPGLIGYQLSSIVSGRADAQNTLFQRLMDDTTVFKQAGITTSKQFNAKSVADRVDLLTKAITVFGDNAEVVEGNMRSLNGQWLRLRTLVIGQFSVFKEIGTAIAEPLAKLLYKVNDFIQNAGKGISKNLANMIRQMLRDPVALYEQIAQMKNLKSDAAASGKVLGMIGLVEGLIFLWSAFRKTGGMQKDIEGTMRNVGKTFGGFYRDFLGNITSFGAGIKKHRAMGVAGNLGWGFAQMFKVGNWVALGNFLKVIFVRILGPLAGFMMIFQGISRGMAKANVTNIKWFAENLELLTRVGGKLMLLMRTLLAPFEWAVEGIAEMVGGELFGFMSLGKGATEFVEFIETWIDRFLLLGKVIVGFLSLLSGAIGLLADNIRRIMTNDWSNGGWDSMWKNFTSSFDDVWTRYFPSFFSDRKPDEGNPVAGKVTNMDVKMYNEFKEQLEPDRIAFTLTEQLMKLAANPGQAAGRSQKATAVGN